MIKENFIGNIAVSTITVQYLDPDQMEEVNTITGISPFNEVNFVDKDTFEDYPRLKKYVDKERLEVLMSYQVEYIMFRLDN